jgi:hypothetical protein
MRTLQHVIVCVLVELRNESSKFFLHDSYFEVLLIFLQLYFTRIMILQK